GLRPDRGDAGGALPHPHPLHVDVAAVSHRQWLVRRLLAGHRRRHRRGQRQYLCGPLVSGRCRRLHRGDRPLLPARNPQARYRRVMRAFAFLVAFALACLFTPSAFAERWVGAWATTQQIPEPDNALAPEDLHDATLRQIVHTTLGGTLLR